MVIIITHYQCLEKYVFYLFGSQAYRLRVFSHLIICKILQSGKVVVKDNKSRRIQWTAGCRELLITHVEDEDFVLTMEKIAVAVAVSHKYI